MVGRTEKMSFLEPLLTVIVGISIGVGSTQFTGGLQIVLAFVGTVLAIGGVLWGLSDDES